MHTCLIQDYPNVVVTFYLCLIITNININTLEQKFFLRFRCPSSNLRPIKILLG